MIRKILFRPYTKSTKKILNFVMNISKLNFKNNNDKKM